MPVTSTEFSYDSYYGLWPLMTTLYEIQLLQQDKKSKRLLTLESLVKINGGAIIKHYWYLVYTQLMDSEVLKC